MKNIRQVILGFLAALLSAAVILGSLSLSLSENGLKLAMQSMATRTPGLRFSTFTRTLAPATKLPGETITLPLFTPSDTATLTPMSLTPALPSPTPSCDFPLGWSPIKIQAGDTLEDLAQFYNVTANALSVANCLVTTELLPDTVLYVPGIPPTEATTRCGPPSDWVLYTVQPGDNLYRIGLAFEVTIAELQFANCMGNSTGIRAGQRIFVPNVATLTPTATKTRGTNTPRPSSIPSEIPTAIPTVQATPTHTPVNTNTPIPTSSPTRRPPITTTITSVPTSPTPTGTPTPTETATPTATMTLTSTPTITPTTEPSVTDTSTPTAIPSNTPTTVPTITPTASSGPSAHRVVPSKRN